MIVFTIGFVSFWICLYAFNRGGNQEPYPTFWKWAYIPFWGMPISVIVAAIGIGMWIAK